MGDGGFGRDDENEKSVKNKPFFTFATDHGGKDTILRVAAETPVE